MKIEYNTSTSALPLNKESEDIVRTMHITLIKALNQKIKSFWDNISSYAGDKDEWKLPVIATRTVTIPKGTRIAQFRIQLKQQASCWQKLRWLFSSKVRLQQVDRLDKPSRGGIGEGTGK